MERQEAAISLLMRGWDAGETALNELQLCQESSWDTARIAHEHILEAHTLDIRLV